MIYAQVMQASYAFMTNIGVYPNIILMKPEAWKAICEEVCPTFPVKDCLATENAWKFIGQMRVIETNDIESDFKVAYCHQGKAD